MYVFIPDTQMREIAAILSFFIVTVEMRKLYILANLWKELISACSNYYIVQHLHIYTLLLYNMFSLFFLVCIKSTLLYGQSDLMDIQTWWTFRLDAYFFYGKNM